MSTIEQSIEVDAPLSTVYNQWTQFEEFPQFMDGVEEVRQVATRTSTGSPSSAARVTSGTPR